MRFFLSCLFSLLIIFFLNDQQTFYASASEPLSRIFQVGQTSFDDYIAMLSECDHRVSANCFAKYLGQIPEVAPWVSGSDESLAASRCTVVDTPYYSSQTSHWGDWGGLNPVKHELGRVANDYRHFYERDTMCNLGLAVVGNLIIANSGIDREFQKSYQKNVRSDFLDDMGDFASFMTGGGLFLPVAVVSSFTYRYLQEYDKLKKPRGPVGDFFSRTVRGYTVGAPALVVGRWVIGSSAPYKGKATWKPFSSGNHGISGTAFLGATPFLTAAEMVERPWLKASLFAFSFVPTITTINDNDAYLSQALLGWYLSYLSVRAVNKTEGIRLPKGLTFFPVMDRGGSGIGLIYQR